MRPGRRDVPAGHRAPCRVDSAAEAADLLRRQRALGLGGGILFCVPIPESEAIPRDEIDAAIERAIDETEAAGIHGPASTPAVLSRVAALTEGRSVVANLALIEHDASVAASLAVALASAR